MLDNVQLEIRISKSQLILNPRCIICCRSYPKHEGILASGLTLEIREFRRRGAKIEVKRSTVTRSQTQDTSGLSHQCFATELQQPDNYQPTQSSICTVQVVLNA